MQIVNNEILSTKQTSKEDKKVYISHGKTLKKRGGISTINDMKYGHSIVFLNEYGTSETKRNTPKI